MVLIMKLVVAYGVDEKGGLSIKCRGTVWLGRMV